MVVPMNTQKEGGLIVPLLRLENVDVRAERFPMRETTLLRDVTFTIGRGESLAIVGESGSGKTTLLRAITSLFPPGSGLTVSGRVLFDGVDILSSGPQHLERLRRGGVRYIFQDPAMAFSPVSRMYSQVRTLIGKDDYDEAAFTAHLEQLGLQKPMETLQSHPHELSTGMVQRISIALALQNRPSLILADEPTSALDAIHRSRSLRYLTQECRSLGASLLISTHDLSLARRFTRNIIVLYKGCIVEQSGTDDFFERPLHPYSERLLHRRPGSNSGATGDRRRARPTEASSGDTIGCVYLPQCPMSQNDCHAWQSTVIPANDSRGVRCLYWK